jgi:glycerophosphoryl diester phosphodiesterase
MSPDSLGDKLPLPYVAAHRGASRLAPENTLTAFSAALDRGALAIELDVHLSADGRAVVIHDDLVDRTTDGQGQVSRTSYAELKRLDAGSWWSAQFSGERLPLLDEVFEMAQGRAVLHVELKGPGVDILAAQVVDLARRFGASHQIVVMSFDLDAVLAARRHAPDIPAIAILGETLPNPVGFVEATGLSGLNQAVQRWVPSTVQEFHKRGWLVHGSLVNDQDEVDRFFALGGDMVDSDSPDCWPGERYRAARLLMRRPVL